MQITTFSDYSLRVLMYLAIAGDRRSSAREIAEKYEISSHHVAKVSQWLVHQGHISATRGKGGGLKLAREATEIKIGDVIRKAERGSALVECMRQGGGCAINGPCGLTGILAEAQEAFFKCLDQYNLKDTITNQTKIAALLKIAAAG
jgi:Rrf2 family transcriptional regulator, nitric oxide-sensitive transcriptional repressor